MKCRGDRLKNIKNISNTIELASKNGNIIEEMLTSKIEVAAGSYSMKYFSKGKFSKIYKIDDNLVVKALKKAGSEDTIKYLKYCEKNHKNNPYLPKVFKTIENDEACSFLMEYLYSNYTLAVEFINKNITYMSRDWKEIRLDKDCPHDFRTIIVELRKYRRTNKNIVFDFHDENILFRHIKGKKYHPVVSDPIYDFNALAEVKKIERMHR